MLERSEASQGGVVSYKLKTVSTSYLMSKIIPAA
jgi:hypothetical protein